MTTLKLACLQEGETPETWRAILEGLVSLCSSLAALSASEGAQLPEIFSEVEVSTLHAMSTESITRAAVVRLASSFVDLPASRQLQQRYYLC